MMKKEKKRKQKNEKKDEQEAKLRREETVPALLSLVVSGRHSFVRAGGLEGRSEWESKRSVK